MNGLYVLDIYVSKLILNRTTYEDTGGADLTIRISIIQFSPVECPEYKRMLKSDSLFVDIHAGQTRHFYMKHEDLAKRIKTIPLLIGVYRVGDTYPICYTHMPLSGHMHELKPQFLNQTSSFDFKGPFDLYDPGGTYAGQIGVDISITPKGRFVVTSYALGPGYFALKNSAEGNEYECCDKKVSEEVFHRKEPLNLGNQLVLENVMKDIVGISPLANHLALGRPTKLQQPPLIDPNLDLQSNSKAPVKQKGKKKRKKK